MVTKRRVRYAIGAVGRQTADRCGAVRCGGTKCATRARSHCGEWEALGREGKFAPVRCTLHSSGSTRYLRVYALGFGAKEESYC